MDPIADIKERIDIVALVGRYVQLTRQGRVQTALCPFHAEKTPSFVVWPGSQHWHCFGACNAGGDVFDFVMRREHWDFRTAVRELARQAGVPLEWNAADAQTHEERRAREAVFAVAARFYQDCLARSSAAQAYAAGRGWAAETIDEAALGFFPGDWDALRGAFRAGGVDPEAHPVAQALLHMPPEMLVYVHRHNGRVTYLSARAITNKKHWNPPQDLVGARQPYYNQVWRPRVPLAVVVEGQADAVTLGQWGIPAVALAGSAMSRAAGDAATPGERSLAPLALDLARCEAVALALDADTAGEAGLEPAAAALLEAGLNADRIRVVRWPAKDANDWLREGGDADRAQRLLAGAPTWLRHVVSQAQAAEDQAERDALTFRVVALLPALDALHLARARELILDALGLAKETFDTLLRAARREAGQNENGKPQYEVLGGRLCHRSYDAGGNERIVPLANFQARIVADVVEDDGDRQERRFAIEGKLASGQPLPRVEIEAEEFAQMNWPLPRWGARAAVSAGGSTKDHLRVAVLTLSRNIELRYEYSHLGWRSIENRMVYLSGAGAVGAEGVMVRLSPDLAAYRLPAWPQDVRGAMQASLRFLETGAYDMTVPLWAAMYLAPLASIVPASFTIWLFGTTGSLKSTATALAMCHYGRFSYNTPPASWTGTANALELKAFLCKDSPLWIDDFVSQSTLAGNNELKHKADQLLRDWGNRTGRSRMTADLRARRMFVPRGLVISTAEMLPPGQSILSRLFAIEATPEMMTRGADSPLSLAQASDAARYPHALGGYLLWLAERYPQLQSDLPERLFRYTDAARSEGAHLRMPANVAAMFLGAEMGLEYALHTGALDQAAHDRLRSDAWSTLLALGNRQNSMVVEEKPVEMYLAALEQMLAQGACYLRHKDAPDDDARCLPVRRTPVAEFLGWYDEFFWYLLPKVSFGAVWRFYRSTGVAFPDTERGVREKLLEQKLLFPQGDRYSCRVRIGEDLPRVLRITRATALTDSNIGGSSQNAGTAGTDGTKGTE